MSKADVLGSEKLMNGVVIDTNALKLLAVEELNGINFVPVADDVEIIVQALWQEHLGITTILSATANFFKVGGDSLKAGQLVSSMRKVSGVFINVAELFSNPTIRDVSNIIKKRRAEAGLS
jgi:aryl carrier-like protein